MKRLAWLIFVCAAAWSGWWYANAMVTDRVLSGWLDDRRAEGWAADVQQLDTAGFPVQLATTLQDLHLADPTTGVAWQAPAVIITRPVFGPTDITVTLPPEHVLSSPFVSLTITSQTSTARLSVAPPPNLTLWESEIALKEFAVASSQGWTSRIGRADITTTRGEVPLSQIIRADLTDIAPGGPILQLLDPAKLLPESMQSMRIDATATFDKAWDITALENRRPQPRAIDLHTVDMQWGDIELRVAGELVVDAAGVPEGDIAVQIVNWEALLALLQSNGVLPQQINTFALRAVESLAQASGRPDTLDATLTLAGGFIRFGLIPLGPAPRLVIR